MKFVYVDESGGKGQGDVFVMFGLMLDAHSLRKRTEEFEELLDPVFKKHPGKKTDFKTIKFINGKGGWSKIGEDERKEFLRDVCNLAVSKGGKIVGLALSFSALDNNKIELLPKLSHWQISAMFIASLIQKKMQGKEKGKGLTVFIMDDNKVEMPSFSDKLHAKSEWFDGLYEVRQTGKKQGWKPRSQKDRFNQIINAAFAIKSDHATLIQVADVICYVYRRHLELTSTQEACNDEKKFYSDLFRLLEKHRLKLGHCPADRECVKFYNAAKHSQWKL